MHWRASKPCVGAVVVRGGRVLLARRARDPAKGAWDLPGGFLEWGEEPEVGLARELHEETGRAAEVGALVLVAVGAYGEERTLNLVYRAELDGEPSAQDDVERVAWFPLDALPPLAFEHERRAVDLVRSSR